MVVYCIKCGVLDLTCSKRRDLDHEFFGFQWWMQFGIDKGILSQHKRAKGYSYKKGQIKYKTYPMIIPYKQVWYRNRDTELAKHWVKISVRKRKGMGIWLPIKPHKKLLDFKYLRDSLLLQNHKRNYELRLIFDVPRKKVKPRNILAIDLGEKVIATVCDTRNNKLFLGKDIRGIRRHYAWLRKQLGKKKKLKKIRQVGQKEKNIIRNKLHHISNEIIRLAEKNKSIIIVGKIKGIRKKKGSKFLNRIIFNMPYYTLTKMIEYKAEQKGLQVFKVNEAYTSITCHHCGNKDKKNRKSQGLFSCTSCGLQYNADLNGAMNNLQRSKEQRFLNGAMAEAQKSSKNDKHPPIACS